MRRPPAARDDRRDLSVSRAIGCVRAERFAPPL